MSVHFDEERCNWPNCNVKVHSGFTFCSHHWFLMPYKYRKKIVAQWRAGYKHGDQHRPEFVEAVLAAIAYAEKRERKIKGV